MEFGYLDHTTLLIQGSFFHSVLFLRSTKNAFIMQTKSTFFGQCIWSPRKIIQGRMTSSPWNICIVSKGKQLTRFASLVGVLACRGWASLPVWCACLSNSGLCLLAVWTVIRLVALFTFKVRVTGIWNLAKAYPSMFTIFFVSEGSRVSRSCIGTSEITRKDSKPRQTETRCPNNEICKDCATGKSLC
mgnify:CR=1 FL=1